MSFRSKDHSSVGSVSTTQQSIDVPSKADSTSSKRLHSSTRDVVDSETLSIAESSVDPEPENPTNPTPAEPPQDVRTKPLGWLRQMFSRKSTLKDLEARRPDQTDLDSVPTAVPPEAVQRSPGRRQVKQWIGHAFSYSPYLRSRRNIYRPSTKPSTKRSFFRGPRVVSSSVDPPEIGKSLYGEQQVECPPCPLSTREILVIVAVVVIIILNIIAFAIIGKMNSTIHDTKKTIEHVQKENEDLLNVNKALRDDIDALRNDNKELRDGDAAINKSLNETSAKLEAINKTLRGKIKSLKSIVENIPDRLEVFTGILTESQTVQANQVVIFDTVLLASKRTEYSSGELDIRVKGQYFVYLNVVYENNTALTDMVELELWNKRNKQPTSLGSASKGKSVKLTSISLNDNDKLSVTAKNNGRIGKWTSFSVILNRNT